MAASLLILAIAATSIWLLSINEHEQVQRDARDEK
jgi:hypothetical protein